MNICVDAGFLIALYDSADEHHVLATRLFGQLFEGVPHRFVVPWPILYETVSTRLTRRRESIAMLQRDLKLLRSANRLMLLHDRKLREQALEQCFGELERPGGNYRNLSLVDRVVRQMLLNRRLRLHAFITFNPRDFADVCTHQRVNLISHI